MATNDQTRRGGRTDEPPYTMERALKQANELLQNQFGDVDQSAAVSLATFLYGIHSRDEFLRESSADSEMAYGGSPTR